MKVAFDTSVLVAGLLSAHRDHGRAAVWLEAVSTEKLSGVVSVHALGEVWSVLTKLPISPPISPKMARDTILAILRQFEAVPITVAIYENALERCSSKGLRSGAIFDALHLVTAEAIGATAIVTFNERDFARLSVGSSPQVIVPPAPPAVVV